MASQETLSVTGPRPFPWGRCLKDAALAGMLVMLAFSPVTNLVLNQYDFRFLPWRVPVIVNGFALAVLVMLGRLAFQLYFHSGPGRRHWAGRERGSASAGAHVSPRRVLMLGLAVCAGLLLLVGLGLMHAGAGFALILILLLLLLAYGLGLPRLRGKPHPWRLPLWALFLAGLILPVLLNQTGMLPKVWVSNLTLVLIYVLLGMGLNIVVGLAGLLDLGYVAFYAVGAYFLALGAQYLGIGFWTALLLAPLLAAMCGAVLGFPVLRMHGDYLAIVTLGFGEIIRLVLTNWVDMTGGPNGVPAPAPTLFGLEFSRRGSDGLPPFHEFFHLPYSGDYKALFIYGLLFIVVIGVLHAFNRLRRMPLGRSWEALREDEIACRSLGINHVTVKLAAFMMGATTGGIAGVFFATYQGFISPMSFNFFESVLILSIVVLGGMGSTLGVILAAIALTLLPEILRAVADYRILLFGLLMIGMMIWRPYGLVRPGRTRFERREAI